MPIRFARRRRTPSWRLGDLCGFIAACAAIERGDAALERVPAPRNVVRLADALHERGAGAPWLPRASGRQRGSVLSINPNRGENGHGQEPPTREGGGIQAPQQAAD